MQTGTNIACCFFCFLHAISTRVVPGTLSERTIESIESGKHVFTSIMFRVSLSFEMRTGKQQRKVCVCVTHLPQHWRLQQSSSNIIAEPVRTLHVVFETRLLGGTRFIASINK